jgi:hypothetical protein
VHDFPAGASRVAKEHSCHIILDRVQGVRLVDLFGKIFGLCQHDLSNLRIVGLVGRYAHASRLEHRTVSFKQALIVTEMIGED